MITNAKDKPLSSGLPDVRDTLYGLFQRMTFKRITKVVENFSVVEREATYVALGVRQPMTAQQLAIRPEGQRSWKWETVHATPDLVLALDDIIVFSGTKYRVMSKTDWSEYGYVQYDICQGAV